MRVPSAAAPCTHPIAAAGVQRRYRRPACRSTQGKTNLPGRSAPPAAAWWLATFGRARAAGQGRRRAGERGVGWNADSSSSRWSHTSMPDWSRFRTSAMPLPMPTHNEHAHMCPGNGQGHAPAVPASPPLPCEPLPHLAIAVQVAVQPAGAPWDVHPLPPIVYRRGGPRTDDLPSVDHLGAMGRLNIKFNKVQFEGKNKLHVRSGGIGARSAQGC